MRPAILSLNSRDTKRMTSPTKCTPRQLAQYQETGYLLVPQLFDEREMQILLDFAKSDQALIAGVTGRKDATGQITKLTLWNTAGDDLYGMFSR